MNEVKDKIILGGRLVIYHSVVTICNNNMNEMNSTFYIVLGYYELLSLGLTTIKKKCLSFLSEIPRVLDSAKMILYYPFLITIIYQGVSDAL